MQPNSGQVALGSSRCINAMSQLGEGFAVTIMRLLAQRQKKSEMPSFQFIVYVCKGIPSFYDALGIFCSLGRGLVTRLEKNVLHNFLIESR